MTSTSLPQPALPQSPVTVNPWESLAAEARVEREKKAEETWGATMRAAIETDPGVAAEADKLARRIGQPLLAASQDLNFLRGVALMNRMREDRIQSTNPVLYKSLQGLEFARKAWNDYESLGMFERWGQAFTRGELTSQRGRAAAVGDVVGQQAAEARLARMAPTVGFMGNAMEIVGQWASSLPVMAEGAVKGAVVGAGTAAVSSLVFPPAEAITVPVGFAVGLKAGGISALALDQGKIMAGNAYAEMVKAGYDPERAMWASRVLGIANMALEMGGAGLATSGVRTAIRDRLFKAAVNEVRSDLMTTSVWRGFAKEYFGKNIGGETGTEVWEELNTIIAEELAARGGEDDMNPDGVAMRLWEVASKTIQGMAVLGVPSGIGGAARAKMAQETANLVQQELQRAQRILERSELVKNDPEAASQYVGEVLNQREVHVDAQAMREALAKLDADMTASGQLRKSALDQLEAIVPGITEQLETSVGDVSLPMADLLTRLQVEMPELVAALQGKWRPDSDSVEVEQVDAKTQESAEKLAAQADTGTDAEATFREQLRAVEKSAAEQMLAVGGERVGSQGAKDSARLYANVVGLVARSENLSPEEASKKYGPTFLAEETAGRGLFDRARMAIVFGPSSGPETAAHELVHWATDVVERLDAAGSTYGKQQMDVLLQRWNLTREQWAAMDLAARRPYLEDIAYNAEEYFATGEAPSEELRGVFQRMKALIVGLYRGMRSALVQGGSDVRGALEENYRKETGGQALPAMTPELRGYLDRLFASEEAIEIEKATRNGAAALLGEQVSGLAGIDPADVAEIRQRAEEADAEAKERLTSEVLRGSRYYQAAKRNAETDANRKLAEAEAKVRAEVEREVSASPVYLAMQTIRSGEVIDDNGNAVSAKMDTDAVRRLLGDDEKLEAYYETKATAKQEAVRDAVSAAAEVAASRAPSIGAAVDANLATLEKERQAALDRIEKAADFEVRSRPIYKAIDHISQGTVALDDGTEKPARLDRRAVREIAGKNRLGGAESLFDRIPSKYIRKEGQSPDVVARMFGFDNTLQFLEELAKANFERDVRTEVERGKKESGLWSKDLASQASRMAAEETAASPAAARVAFQAGAKAARAQARIERPELVADLLREYTRKGGTNPELMAMQFGFANAGELLRAIIAAPPMQEAIDQRVRERVEAEEPLADPKEFKRAVEDALHGKAATRLTSTILRAFLKGVKATTAGLEQEARLAARITLERTPVGRINVRQFAAAERRTLQKRDRALKAGKFDEVIAAQRQLLLQQYLTMEAIKVEREIERGVKTASARFGKSNESILKERRNLDTVQAGRVIMGRFGLLPQSMAEAAWASMQQMQQVDPDGYDSLMADVAKEVLDSRPWREVPLDRFRVLAATLDGMWTKSKRSEQFRIAGKMRDRQEILDEMEDGIVQVAGAGTRAGLTMGKAAQKMSAMTVESVMANMTRMEAWAIAMDGGKKGGPFHRYAYQPLADAATAASLELEERMAWVTETLGKFDDLSATVDLSQFSGGHPLASIKTRAELIGAILHMGTESGYRAFILGNKWGEQVGGELVTQWDKALQHAADMGWLTEQDFKLVQSVWDYIGSEIKLRMFAATHENWGYRPVEVQARPVQTPFGQLPGGYYPAKVDKARSTIADDKKLDAIKQGKADFQAANINVPRGQTITRQENAVQPRLLDLNVLGQHLAEAINIIHIQPAIADVARMFSGRNNTMLATLAQVAPYAKRNIVIPALERMSRDSIMAPTNELIRWAATFLRKSASMAFLGFNPKNAALQFTGLANAAAEVGFTNIVSHFMDVMRGNGEIEANIEAKSDAMRVRWSNAMQLMASDLEQMVSPSKLKKAQDVAQRAAFFLQRWAQRKVDAATWSAAYDKAVTELGPTMDAGELDAEAVRRADSAVRITQGSKTPLDVPVILSGNALAQLFTQFLDYPNTVLNQNIAAPVGQRLAVLMWTLMVPTLASTAIGLTFAFGEIKSKGERADDEYWKRLLRHTFGDQVRGAFSLIPVVGGLAGSAMNALYGLDNNAGGLRNQPFAGWSLIDMAQRVFSGQGSPADLLSVGMSAIGIPARPLVNVLRYEDRVAKGKEEREWLDYVRVLLNGN